MEMGENALEKLSEAVWRYQRLRELEKLFAMQQRRVELEKRPTPKEEEKEKLKRIEKEIMVFCANGDSRLF